MQRRLVESGDDPVDDRYAIRDSLDLCTTRTTSTTSLLKKYSKLPIFLIFFCITLRLPGPDTDDTDTMILIVI